MKLNKLFFIVLIFNSFETKSMMREFHYEPVVIKYGSDSDDNDFQCECSSCIGLVNWQKLKIPQELIEHKNINKDKLDKFKKFVWVDDSDEDSCSTEFDENEAKKELVKLSLEEERIFDIAENFDGKINNKNCLNRNSKKSKNFHNNKKLMQGASALKDLPELIQLLENEIFISNLLISNDNICASLFAAENLTYFLKKYRNSLYDNINKLNSINESGNPRRFIDTFRYVVKEVTKEVMFKNMLLELFGVTKD